MKTKILKLSRVLPLISFFTCFAMSSFALEHPKNKVIVPKNYKKTLKATKKALNLLSSNINLGIKNVKYVSEYELTKNQIFK